jgi:broad-specificity NMP kinase
MRKKLIIINGIMGVGKSVVCEKLYDKLDNSVWLDGDWCWMMNPFIVNAETKEMVQDNIAHMLRNFLNCSHYEYVIFSWVMHLEEIFDILLKRLEGLEFDLYKFTIMCTPDELRRRLISRDGMFDEIEDIVQNSIGRLELYEKLDTVKIDTTGGSIDDTVNAIIGKLK